MTAPVHVNAAPTTVHTRGEVRTMIQPANTEPQRTPAESMLFAQASVAGAVVENSADWTHALKKTPVVYW